jgi:hypothetical protein
MRIPVQSETDAFRWAVALICLLVVAVAVGAAAGPIYGVVLVAGAALGVIAWEFGTRDPEAGSPLRDVSGVPAADGARHRVLVVANETVGGGELRAELVHRLERAPEIRVVCPILPSRAHLLTSDIDHELAEARRRLDQTLAWAAEHHLHAHGRVSADTPLEAVADELRTFPANEVIVSTHPPERSRWLETGLVEQLRAELEIPVSHVVVDLSRG